MTVRRSIVGVLFCLLIAVVARPVTGQSETQLVITSIALGDSSITIKGKNFGSVAPKVTVGGTQLTIVTSSSSEIVTALPSLASGVYEVEVTRDGATTSDGTGKTSLLVP
jgi:hypothetical protein